MLKKVEEVKKITKNYYHGQELPIAASLFKFSVFSNLFQQ